MLTDHKAAVKALDWCPSKRGLLASGGESADRCIKFWDSSTGKMKRSIDRLSDFVAIVWSKSSDELCSAHGYAENPLIVWDYTTMSKLQELKEHKDRVRIGSSARGAWSWGSGPVVMS